VAVENALAYYITLKSLQHGPEEK